MDQSPDQSWPADVRYVRIAQTSLAVAVAAYVVSAAPGGDIALSEERLAAEQAFANKIWNASRLLFSKSKEGPGEPASLADRWIASRLSAATTLPEIVRAWRTSAACPRPA